jgi:uncharacterized protein (TIGR02646 family)
MRRVTRLPLSTKAKGYLAKRQKRVSVCRKAGTLDIEREWSSARQTGSMRDVVALLRRMMGERERCMYCLDSHGSDIEHFWPKRSFPARMFLWPNLLLCCTECGRLKGDRFPRQGRLPLLIDPTGEDPWQHLDFDPRTGNLTARYDKVANDVSTKGKTTVELFQLDRREALSAGHLKTWRRFCMAQSLKNRLMRF